MIPADNCGLKSLIPAWELKPKPCRKVSMRSNKAGGLSSEAWVSDLPLAKPLRKRTKERSPRKAPAERGILLSILCSSISFCASQIARAQEAASPGLLEPAITVKATPPPRPKKRTSELTVEIPTEASSEKPPPIAEETPRAEELATTAPPTEKKTRAKKHATPGAQPGPPEFPIVSTMSLSAAKAVAVSTPIPEYPYQARRAHITSIGVCSMP